MNIDTDNTGLLFYNEEKKSAKYPDFSGQINVEGKQYRIAGWNNEGKKGEYIGLKISDLEESEPVAEKAAPAARRTYQKPSRR